MIMVALMGPICAQAQHGNHCDGCEDSDKKGFKTLTTDSTHHHGNKHEHTLYWSDVSVHISKPLPKELPWSIKVWAIHHSTKRVVVDIHTGFHFKNTLDASIGYDVLKKKGIWLVPKLSVLVGEYTGYAPGLMFRLERKRWYVFTETEYLGSLIGQPHMIFNFTEIGYSPHRSFELGIISEIKWKLYYKDIVINHTEFHYDIGPVARFNIKSVYVEGWWALDPVEMNEHHSSIYESSTITLAVGWKFNKCE